MGKIIDTIDTYLDKHIDTICYKKWGLDIEDAFLDHSGDVDLYGVALKHVKKIFNTWTDEQIFDDIVKNLHTYVSFIIKEGCDNDWGYNDKHEFTWYDTLYSTYSGDTNLDLTLAKGMLDNLVEVETEVYLRELSEDYGIEGW